MSGLVVRAAPEMEFEDVDPVRVSTIRLRTFAVRVERTGSALNSVMERVPPVADPGATPHVCSVCNAMDAAEARWRGL